MSSPRFPRFALPLLTLLSATACGDDAKRGDHDAGPNAHPSDSDIADGAVGDDDAGPDGGEAGDDDLRDRAGTRLRATGVAVGELFHRSNIHDDVLDVNCDFMDLSPDDDNGLQHCVPSSFTELRFARADCTDDRLLVRANSACLGARGPGDIVRVMGASACGANTSSVRRLGAVATDATYYMRAYGTGECVEAEVGSATIYMPEPLEPSALVSGRIEAVPSGEPGLELERVAGSDGSRFPIGLRWSDGTRCDPQPLGPDEDAAQPCLPIDALSASENTYADSACSEPVFSDVVDACGDIVAERKYGLSLANVDGCQRPSALYTLGATLDSLYSGPPDTCSESFAVPEDWRSFARGEARPMSTLPSILRRFHGPSRLRMAHLTTQGGAPVIASHGLFDAELDDVCYPRRFADGRMRCMPSRTVWYSGHFADDECTVPVYVTFVGGCNPARDLPRFVTRDEDAADLCSERIITEVRRTVPHTGTVYFRSDTGCGEWTLDPSEAAFVDGEVIDPSTLAEVTEIGG